MDSHGQRPLIDFMRHQSGVEVRGSNANPMVLVRGVQSTSANNEPIYVVDGVIV
ncbi:MAG: hypothetical protein HKN87_22030 [Saprospiraceae bacterium]|nr:hypothetical protein [Saprospiraceae bacterium]